ncbi:hypothetical protein K2173_006355 [Erythroxylum novogranatense]|uniref:RING-type domain-containing protein n=1 Tax=Erythroxylum novogranatense TaxID=1862640 RepID=A0AAV8U5V1_9ROSI|nr:hypothetical protein K2173_006355 [Erythroxylum novogranatense]
MVPHEPYWQTNSSFSPHSAGWDFRFPSEVLPYDSHDDNIIYGSQTSSNSKVSELMQSNHLFDPHSTASDGAGLYHTSPDDISQGPQWTPPAIQEISVDDYEPSTRRGRPLGRFPSALTEEGTSSNLESSDFASSLSDGSDAEPTFKSCLLSHRSFSSCNFFSSKPIHPLYFSSQIPRVTSDFSAARFSDFDSASSRRDTNQWSSAISGNDFADVSESFQSERLGPSCTESGGFRCGLCEKLLSQRSPWSSRRIVRSGDMPVAGVLPCCHVFHAECLEQTTPKASKSDPPCPICARLGEETSPEHCSFPRFKNGFSRLRTFSDDGPSRSWGCTQTADVVEGPLSAPTRNTMLVLSRNRMKRNVSLMGNSGKEFPGKLRKNGLHSTQLLSGNSVDLRPVGCSKAGGSPSMKR